MTPVWLKVTSQEPEVARRFGRASYAEREQTRFLYPHGHGLGRLALRPLSTTERSFGATRSSSHVLAEELDERGDLDGG
jgi:hypothetical protein